MRVVMRCVRVGDEDLQDPERIEDGHDHKDDRQDHEASSQRCTPHGSNVSKSRPASPAAAQYQPYGSSRPERK